MADISKINGYGIKDATARENHDALVKEVNELIDQLNDALDVFLPLTGGELTGALTTKDVTLKGIEQFQTHYAKKLIGALSAGTAYANLDSKYKDGTYHRMWRLRFPASCNFWGKIKITLYGGYSSFNASGIMSKSITCNFNGSSIYNNVGFYDGLGVNVEKDFRISEAIWNSTASAWEILIWQKNLNGNNSPTILLEAWSSSETYLTNAKNITAQAVELTQATTYTASNASSTGGTKTVTWANTPVYETPLGEEIATMSDIPSVPSVSVTQKLTSGTEIASIQVGSTTTKLYAPTATVTGGDYLPLSGGTINGRLGFSDGSNDRLVIEYDELYTPGELFIGADNGVTIDGATGVSIDGYDGLILKSSRSTATLTSLEAMTLTGGSVYISASEGNLELKSSDNFTLDLSDVATFSGAVYAPFVFVKNTAGDYSDVFSVIVALSGAIQTVDDKLRDYATQTYVDNSVASLVGGAPETLNALNELAAALGNDPNFATTVSTEIGKKQATITGAATTITSSNLTASRVLISNGSGKVAVSDITSTELGYLDGVTSNIQTQLNNKTDTKVTQTKTTSASSMPLLLAPAGQTATATTTANFTNNIYAIPSTGRLYVTGGSNPLFGLQATGGTQFFLQALTDTLYLGPTSAKALAFTGSTGAISMPNNLTVAGSISEGGTALSSKYQAKGDYLTSVPTASSSALGGIKLGYTTSGKNYKVQVDGSGNAYVNVPWTGGSTVDLSGYTQNANNPNLTYYATDNGTTTAGTWLGKNDNVTSLFDGLSVNYKVTKAGASTTTFNLNGLGAKTVYLRGTTKLTTHYEVGTIVNMIYNSSTGAWYVADYDANSYAYLRQYYTLTTTNGEYPIIYSYTTDTGTSSYKTAYGAVKGGFTFNPSTDTLTVTNLNGTANKVKNSLKFEIIDNNGDDETTWTFDGSEALDGIIGSEDYPVSHAESAYRADSADGIYYSSTSANSNLSLLLAPNNYDDDAYKPVFNTGLTYNPSTLKLSIGRLAINGDTSTIVGGDTNLTLCTVDGAESIEVSDGVIALNAVDSISLNSETDIYLNGEVYENGTKLEDKYALKTEIGGSGSTNTKTPYATSSTAAATAAKVATISSNDDNFELAIGQRVLVKFTYANTVASPTLNVNSTGAKTIYTADYLTITATKGWTAGDVCEFMYNGTYWIWINSTINAANIQNGTIPAARLPYAAKSTSSSTTAGTKGAVRIRVYNGDLYIHTS